MTDFLPDPHQFAERVGSWLLSSSPESDVVVSCRVRLARNVHGFPFIPKLGAEQAEELCLKAKEFLVGRKIDGETLWVSIPEAPTVLRLVLRERYLCSRDLAPSDERRAPAVGRAVAFGDSESLSVMVNEEDHLRLQGLASGFDLPSAWQKVHAIDRALEDSLPLSWSKSLGYLTSCPTNVGTGMRASVMLHLPALGMVRPELEKVFAAAQRTGLAVRGMYGEGSRAAGDFYQISNQITLGCSETQLLADLSALVPSILDFERKLRGLLFEEQGPELKDRISRSYGLLRTARSLSTEAALAHLSMIRLGQYLGIVHGPTLSEMNQIAVQIQRGHLLALNAEREGVSGTGPLPEGSERDRLRAGYLRRRFAERK